MPLRESSQEPVASRSRIITQKVLGVSTAIILALLLGDIAVLYSSLGSVREHELLLSHTHDVLAELERAESALMDAQAGFRGFVLTMKESFLEPYQTGRLAAVEHLRQVKALTVSNLALQPKLEELRATAMELLAWYAEVADRLHRSGQSGSLESVQGTLASGRGKELMDKVGVLIEDLKDTEHRLISERAGTAQTSERQLDRSILAAAGISIFLVLLAYYYIRRSTIQQVSDAKRLADDAWLRNGVSELAEAMLGIGTVEAVGQGALDFFARYVGAQLGTLYVLRHGSLDLAAVFARPGETERISRRLAASESLVGEAIRLGRVVEITDVPESYIKVSSSLGEARPKTIVVVPFFAAGEPVGARKVHSAVELPANTHSVK
jgi:CHASE3 domain sensor protein